MTRYRLPLLALAATLAITAPGHAAADDAAAAASTTPAATAAEAPDVPAPRPTPAPLSDHHRNWLENEVVWIISEYERDAFLSLPSDEDRRRFIEAFWLARDPTTATRENEFKSQHYQRVRDADRLFGRNKKRPGSKTIRGQIYVQLGPPVDRMVYPMERRLYPLEHWFYHGGKAFGLPPFFNVVFFQPYGAGEWELYDPFIHGPERLVGGTQDSGFSHSDPMAAASREAALTEIGNVSPQLQRAALSLDPSEPYDATNFIPSHASRRLVAKLEDLGNHLPVEKDYVERIVHGQPDVTVEYSFKQLGMRSTFLGGYLPGGATAVQYVIEVPPASLTLERYKDTIGGALQIVGRIFAADGTTPVLQIDETIELRMTPEELRRVQSNPLALEDLVPLLPGEYRASLVVRNVVSKEFGVVDQRFTVPEPGTSGLTLGPLLLPSDGREVTGSVPLPFRIGDQVWYPSHDGELPLGTGQLLVTFPVAYPTDRYGIGDRIALRWSLSDAAAPHAERLAGESFVKLNPVYDQGVVAAVIRNKTGDLGRGSYLFRVEAVGKVGDRAHRELTVVATTGPRSPQPWVRFTDRRLDPAGVEMSFAEQYLVRGDEGQAIARFQLAVDDRRYGAPARLRLTELLLGQRRFTEAIAAIEPAARDERSAYALLLLGLARSGAGDSAAAIEAFERAVADSPRSTRVLNVLAEEWLRSDGTDQARALFSRSLELDPEQPDIRTRLAGLGPAPAATNP